MIRTVLATLLSHYRRHPGQLAMLVLGVWIASALWSGVQAINTTARDSYARASSVLSDSVDRLERRDGQPLERQDLVRLRRAGHPVSPILEQTLDMTGPMGPITVKVIGLDPLSLPSDSQLGSPGNDLSAFLLPPYRTQLATETRERLGLAPPGESLAAVQVGDVRLPPLVIRNDLPPDTLVMDMAAAAQLLDSDTTLTRLVAPAGALAKAPDGYRLTRAGAIASPRQLTDSFHLNLTALALLSLVVGLFIVQAALALALEQRLATLRTLRSLGTSPGVLVTALILELLVIGLSGALAGISSGVWLATRLLPDVAATLGNIYQADVSTTLSLPWQYWLGGLGVTLGGLFLAGTNTLWQVARLKVLQVGQAQAWRQRQQRHARRLLGVALIATLCLGLLALALDRSPPGEGLMLGFAMVACTLLISVVSLPALLGRVLSGLETGLRRRPLLQWALADARLQLPRLNLAMMALLMALATSLGVSSMVGGFRLTFLDWLDQRLAAPLYVNAPEAQRRAIQAWLEAPAQGAQVLVSATANATLVIGASGDVIQARAPVSLAGVTPTPLITASWPLVADPARPADPWHAMQQGDVFINEQLATRYQLAPGDRLQLLQAGQSHAVKVAAVYPDYGNPSGQVLMPSPRLLKDFSGQVDALGVALDDPSRSGALRQALTQRFELASEAVIDQQEVKTIATRIFERTFTITRALNVLTLGVAALALLTTLLAQADQRRQCLAPLWALGVPRATLAGIGLCQLGGIAALTGLLAVPLGLTITWLLVKVINVAAFGWQLPLHLFPSDILITLATAIGVALLAAALPAVALWRASPRQLLSEVQT